MRNTHIVTLSKNGSIHGMMVIAMYLNPISTQLNADLTEVSINFATVVSSMHMLVHDPFYSILALRAGTFVLFLLTPISHPHHNPKIVTVQAIVINSTCMSTNIPSALQIILVNIGAKYLHILWKAAIVTIN